MVHCKANSQSPEYGFQYGKDHNLISPTEVQGLALKSQGLDLEESENTGLSVLTDLNISESMILILVSVLGILFYFFCMVNLLSKRIIKDNEFLIEELQLSSLKLKSDNSGLVTQIESIKSEYNQRSRFFANIIHEFRTPLTLLLSPLEEVFMNEGREFSKTQILLMLKNSRKLLRLVNQLLEISKIEAGAEELNIRRGDLVEVLNSVSLFFVSMAEKKEIDFVRKLPIENPICYFDPEKLEKIISNLLSNSFKFTPINGEVILSAEFLFYKSGEETEVDKLVIMVEDSGVGVHPDNIPKLFNLFYQVEEKEGREYEGSGIGLALVKELVEKYHGSIEVENRSRGVKFTVTIPVNRKYFTDKEFSKLVYQSTLSQSNDMDFLDTPGASIISDWNKEEFDQIKNSSVILVIEDNEDLRILIREKFERNFLIREAKNGLEGLALALEIIPDLIITDLIMPRMSGLEVCSRLKSDERTNHIPILILTGKSTIEEKVKGLETGADDYLTKPFHLNELEIRAFNLIEQRKKLKSRYEKQLKIPKQELKVIGKDERFLDKAMKVVESNIANSGFNVELFQKEMGMSRMQLHRKLKALSEKSSSEFIRLIRMKRAAELILTDAGTISEIAYEVGFNDPSYFTKCFRNEFGIPPSEYKNSILQNS